MKFQVFILIASFIAYSNALSCLNCAGCNTFNTLSQTCLVNQPYCYTSISGSYVEAGCAATCTPGAYVSCCTTNFCNTIPVVATTRPPLICYACTNCLYTNAVYQTCQTGQNYCYVTYSGTLVNAGCAATCTPGTSTSCCTTSYCNPPRSAARVAAEVFKGNDEENSEPSD